MKNWILWMVLAILFIGAGVVFFILWNKEKKKSDAAKLIVSKPAEMSQPAAAVSSPAETNPTVAETNIAGRNVATLVPTAFGSTVN